MKRRIRCPACGMFCVIGRFAHAPALEAAEVGKGKGRGKGFAWRKGLDLTDEEKEALRLALERALDLLDGISPR